MLTNVMPVSVTGVEPRHVFVLTNLFLLTCDLQQFQTYLFKTLVTYYIAYYYQNDCLEHIRLYKEKLKA